MGSRSKVKKFRPYRSSRMIREYCAAHGLNFNAHIAQFPLAACKFRIRPEPLVLKPSLWTKIKDFICRLVQKTPK